MSKSGTKDETMPFEKAMERLGKIVEELEEGKCSLEKAVELFEEGQKLRAICDTKLKQARLRVEKITQDSGGKPSARAAEDILPEEES